MRKRWELLAEADLGLTVAGTRNQELKQGDGGVDHFRYGNCKQDKIRDRYRAASVQDNVPIVKEQHLLVA